MSAKRGSQIEEWGNSRYQDGLKAGAAQRDALLAAAKAAEIQLKGYWLDAPNEICKPDIDKAWRLVRNAIEIAEAKR